MEDAIDRKFHTYTSKYYLKSLEHNLYPVDKTIFILIEYLNT